MVEGTKTYQIRTKVRNMQDFMEGNVETAIRKYSAKADRPSASNRDMIVPSHSHKLIDGIHIRQEVLLVGEHVSCGAAVKEYSSGGE